MLCEYGCGREGKYQFKNGKWCCEKNQAQCPSIKKKISKKSIELWNDPNSKVNSLESRKILSEKIKDIWADSNSIYNSDEFRKKMSQSQIGKKQKLTTIEKRVSQIRGRPRLDLKGRKPWNKGKKGCYSKETLTRMKEWKRPTGREPWNKGNRISLEDFTIRFPFVCKVEELRKDPKTGKIQAHCKNHNCSNSKEKGGWFTPTQTQLYARACHVEREEGMGGCYLYCSEECKQSCTLYRKTVMQLIKEDKIRAGYLKIKEFAYTSEEYNTWRQEVLKRADYKCEYCGEKAIHCHHIKPQKLEPFFSLDPDYGIACCRNCHYKYGHPTGTECSTGNLAAKIC